MRTTLVGVLIVCCAVAALPLSAFSASESISQTKYGDINEFQEARWQEIVDGIFEKQDGTGGTSGDWTPTELNDLLGTDGGGE